VTLATVTELNPRRGLVTQTEGLDEEQLTKVFQRARGAQAADPVVRASAEGRREVLQGERLTGGAPVRLIREAVQEGSRLEEGAAPIRGPASSVRNTKARRALRARVATAGFAARARPEGAGHEEGRKVGSTQPKARRRQR
jgi:hypothetical protein